MSSPIPRSAPCPCLLKTIVVCVTPGTKSREDYVLLLTSHVVVPVIALCWWFRAGTSANLFPVPIIGSYGWILNAWRLREPERFCPVSVRVTDQARRLSLSFEEVDGMPDKKAKSIVGVVTGDYNVSDAIRELGGNDSISDHELTFFDKTGKKLLTEVSQPDLPSISSKATLWSAPGLQFHARDGAKYGPVEVLDVCYFLDAFVLGSLFCSVVRVLFVH